MEKNIDSNTFKKNILSNSDQQCINEIIDINEIKYKYSFNDFVVNNILNTKDVQLKFFKSIKNINKTFSKKLGNQLSSLFNLPIKIKHTKLSIKSIKNYFKVQPCVIYEKIFEINHSKNFLCINIPKRLVSLIVNNIFGNFNVNFCTVNNVNKSITEDYINNKCMYQIVNMYSALWNKKNVFNTKSISCQSKIKIIKNDYKISDLFFVCFFKVITSHWSENFVICLSLNASLYIRNKIINTYLTKKINNTGCCYKNNVSINILSVLKINLVAQLKPIKLSLQELLEIKIGDVISIENPDNVIIYINKMKMFSGKCIIYNKKYAVCINNCIN